MDASQFAAATSKVRGGAVDCPKCRYPVLCAKHAVALVALRRERETILLRGDRR